jgi:UDP-N-acetylmuramoyl-L-alanyl-D-glutamate--2,6-diaminopimelate ligase
MKTFRTLAAYLAPQFVTLGITGNTQQINIPIRRIVADSRQVQPGDLFVAIQGAKYDGHTAIADVLERGAVGIIGSVEPGGLYELVPEPWVRGMTLDFAYMRLFDTRLALALANSWLHGFPSREMPVIGVTGTDGKTTTSSLIEAILVEATRSESIPNGSVGVITTVGARILGEESATGLHVTTPDAPEVQQFLADMRDAGCTYAVVESTSHGLDQKRVAGVDYDIAVVTNITHEHLDYHGTREAYVAAKARLFRMLFHSPAKVGVPRYAILNADDAGSLEALKAAIADEESMNLPFQAPDVPVILNLEKQVVQTRSYGMPSERKPDLYATNVEYRPDSIRFRLHWWWGPAFDVHTPLIGEFNLYNVMAAASVTLALGVPSEIVAQGIANFKGVLGRMERMDAGQEFTAIVDFAHSPASLERALNTLRPLVGVHADGTPGRLIAVFGSAGLRDRAKRKWMGQISGRLADFTLVTAEDPRTEDVNDICAEIASGVREFVDDAHFAIVPDRTAAIQYAVDIAQSGDIVAAFGKGHERSMCYGETEHPWSDQGAMMAALNRRMGIA